MYRDPQRPEKGRRVLLFLQESQGILDDHRTLGQAQAREVPQSAGARAGPSEATVYVISNTTTTCFTEGFILTKHQFTTKHCGLDRVAIAPF